ncbi:TPA: hypothetical protein ACX6NR_002407 [Photobacterium damselae]
MKKNILTTTLISLISFSTYAGQLIIENGNGKVMLSSDNDNNLTINGENINSNKKIYNIDGTVLGNVENVSFIKTRNSNTYYYQVEYYQDGELSKLSDTSSQLITVKLKDHGEDYIANINEWGDIPASLMLYTDPDCKNAAYVSALTIPSGILYKNTIVGAQFQDKAWIVKNFTSLDEIDVVKNTPLYAYSSQIDPRYLVSYGTGELHCHLLTKENGDYNYIAPVPITPLPEGIVTSERDDNNGGIPYYWYHLSNAKGPLSLSK